QQIAQHPSSGERQLQVQLVDPAHPLKIFGGCAHGLVIHIGARDTQKLGLPRDRQRMRAIHQRFPLGPSSLPSAPDKKSISSACCPIFACSSFRLDPSCFAGAPEEKTSAAPSSSCDRHCVIWFGCTSNRSASCARVSSPFSAASATF